MIIDSVLAQLLASYAGALHTLKLKQETREDATRADPATQDAVGEMATLTPEERAMLDRLHNVLLLAKDGARRFDIQFPTHKLSPANLTEALGAAIRRDAVVTAHKPKEVKRPQVAVGRYRFAPALTEEPKIGTEYWLYHLEQGAVRIEYTGDAFDRKMFSLGEMYSTRADCESAARAQRELFRNAVKAARDDKGFQDRG